MSNFAQELYGNRHRYQEFAWYPCNDMTIAKSHLEYGCEALHADKAICSADGKTEELLEAVRKNNKLKALFLPENNLGNRGTRMISEFLKTDDKLKYLFLEKNGINDAGLKTLIEGLRVNNTINTVMLGQNEITRKGCEFVADFLASEDSSNILELALGKDIDDQGAAFLAKGLMANQTLRSLYLLDTKIKATGSQILIQTIGWHPCLNTLEVTSDTIQSDDFQENIKKKAIDDAQKLFDLSMKEGGSAPWLRSKIMFVGQGRAGKTATVRSLLGLPFQKDLASTVGADVQQSATRGGGSNGWRDDQQSAAGKFDFSSDTAKRIVQLKMQQRRLKAYDDIKSLDIDSYMKNYEANEKKWNDDVLAARSKKATVEFDIDQEEVSKQVATMVTNTRKNLNPGTDISFDIWDYGGQKVFYTLHHLFLTRYGVYMVVFDLRDLKGAERPEGLEEEVEKLETDREKERYLASYLEDIERELEEDKKENKKQQKNNMAGKIMEGLKAKKAVVGAEEERKQQEKKATRVKFLKAMRSREKAKEYLNFWLHSVQMHAPDAKMMLIGTFLDSYDSHAEGAAELQNAEVFIQSLTEKFQRSIVKNESLGLSFFPLANNDCDAPVSAYATIPGGSSSAITEIRDSIDATARKEAFVNQPVSLRWVKCLDLMLKEEKSYWDIDKVRELGNKYLVQGPECDQMLEFFHELGVLVHLKSTVALRRVVVTKPQWLINGLSQVIRDKDLHKVKHTEKVIGKEVDAMFESGLASDFVLRYLWKDAGGKGANKEKIYSFFVDLMRHTMLLSDYDIKSADLDAMKQKRKEDWMVAEKNYQSQDKFFLVPSLITAEPKEDRLKEFTDKIQGFDEGNIIEFKSSDDVPRTILLDFSKAFLPNGVFQRLVCLLTLYASSSGKAITTPTILMNYASIDTGDGKVIIYMHKQQIYVKIDSEHLHKTWTMIRSMLYKLRSDIMNDKLDWDVYAETQSKNDKSMSVLTPYEDVEKDLLAPWLSEFKKDEIEDAEFNIDMDTFLGEFNL